MSLKVNIKKRLGKKSRFLLELNEIPDKEVGYNAL